MITSGLTVILLVGISFAVAFAQSDTAATPARQQTTTLEAETAPPTSKAKNYLATILQSGSTNSRPYRVVILKDGSATAEISGGAPSALHIGAGQSERSQAYPRGTVDTKTLRRLLKQIRDVSKIPNRAACIKSASFGTRTQIEYADKMSGDLQCIGQVGAEGDQKLQQASEELGKFVQTTLTNLNVNGRKTGSD